MADDAGGENHGPLTSAKKTAGRPATRKRRRRWRWLLAAAVILVVLWFLPTIVAKTPLLGWILKLATADLNGSVTVQSASLSWLSPIEVAGVEVKDAAGKRVLSVGAIVGDRRLGEILLHYSKLGKFSLYGTQLAVVVRDDGTNVEDVLAKYLSSKGPSSSKIGLAIEIDKATASVVDGRTGLGWKIEIPKVTFDMSEGPDGPIRADAALEVSDARGPAKVQAGLTMTSEQSTATLSIQQFPLEMLRTLAARLMPGATVTGRLSSDVSLAWGGKQTDKNVGKAVVNVTGFSLAGPATSLAGECNLTADVAVSNQGVGVRQASLTVTPLVVASAGVNINEPVVRLAAQGDYDFKSQTIQLARCELTTSMLTAAVGGNLAPADGRTNAQFAGQVNYDLERLGSLLQSSFGPNVRLVGRGSSQLWYRGPLALETGTAAAAFRCDGADIFGFPLGPADVKATLAGGTVQIEPIDLAIGQGRIHLAPQVRLAPGPVELRLPKGPLVQNVQVSGAMCGSLLQYIAPALAGVTAVQGTFSIELDDCRIPLSDPKQADVAGRLTIHSMTIGSSPLVRELAVLQTRASAAQLQSVVSFHLANGRVEHSNLVLAFPEITIRTHGSIGLDQTLDVVAEMAVPSKWLAGNPVAARAAQGQAIAIPLRGTLAKPALDQKALQDNMARFVKNAATNVIEGGLNQLLGPKK